jgi:hypothetical protein
MLSKNVLAFIAFQIMDLLRSLHGRYRKLNASLVLQCKLSVSLEWPRLGNGGMYQNLRTKLLTS